MHAITVIKNNHKGEEVWHYSGRILQRSASAVCLEAIFNRDDLVLDYVTFRRGDRMVEFFYTDRWYNIFVIHDVADDHIKGWYCNITRPAVISEGMIAADDLALDLFVAPDGQTRILDRDEFDVLDISQDERVQALAALNSLMACVKTREHPFEAIV